jgi:hypothetical protein
MTIISSYLHQWSMRKKAQSAGRRGNNTLIPKSGRIN